MVIAFVKRRIYSKRIGRILQICCSGCSRHRC